MHRTRRSHNDMDRKEGVTKQPVRHECKVSIYHVLYLLLVISLHMEYFLICFALQLLQYCELPGSVSFKPICKNKVGLGSLD